MNEEIWNDGLLMAMEFGPNLNQPINERILEKYPSISPDQARELNEVCYIVRNQGHDFIYGTLSEVAGKKQTITATNLESQLKSFLLSKYQWISNENMGRLFSQSCYYAWKDGLIEFMQD